MPGLLRKAQALKTKMRRRANISSSPQMDFSEKNSKGSEEEHQEILSQIDGIVAEDRIHIKAETLAFTPQKSDKLLPLLFNLVAAAAVISGVLLLFLFFNREERTLLIESSAVLSTEGRLLAALRKESKQQLKEKEAKIAQIQDQLNLIRKERDSIKTQTDERIRRREEMLRTELDQELEIERRKLQDQGLLSEAIEEQLNRLRSRLEAENRQQLEQFHRQSTAELADKEAALNIQMAEIDQQMLQARQDLDKLEKSFARKEEALQTRFKEQTAALESERDRVSEQFNRLQDRQQQEQLVFDQLLSGYRRVQASINDAQYDRALQELAVLESLLKQEGVALLPAVQRRSSFEGFVIATLKRNIEEAQSAGIPAEDSRIELLKRISVKADQADRLLKAGDLDGAHNNYLAALAEIPELKEVYAGLLQREQQAAAQENRKKADQSRLLQGEISSLKIKLAKQKEKISSAETAQARLVESEEKRQTLAAQLDLVKDQYESVIASSAVSTTAQEDLLVLLETKLLVKQIISSEPVRSQYPKLYDSLEEYFESFGQEQETAGQIATLKDISILLDGLIEEKKIDPNTILAPYTGDKQNRLFLEVMAKLKRLLE